jgi:hypothetical protein
MIVQIEIFFHGHSGCTIADIYLGQCIYADVYNHSYQGNF